MAAAYRGRLYVVGGYPGFRRPLREAFVLEQGRWRRLPRPPEGRAAAGAAFVDGKLHVVGGVGPSGLATRTLVYDPARGRWSTAPAPAVLREHLAVTSLRGRVYALGGRRAGYDTNVAVVESWAPGERRWRRHPGIPHPRGGTGAAAIGGALVSVGGEEPQGTIASVYALAAGARSWERLPALPTPRHGLGVVTASGRIYAVGGGPEPGLTVSDANEYLTVE
jgi:N-acetylneuraminic acid mutarotase